MNMLRQILFLLFALGLVTGEGVAAFQQGQMAGSRTLTICSPQGSHEIRLGAGGKPISGPTHDHNCCLFVAAGITPQTVGFLPRSTVFVGVVYPDDHDIGVTVTRQARARSPPLAG